MVPLPCYFYPLNTYTLSFLFNLFKGTTSTWQRTIQRNSPPLSCKNPQNTRSHSKSLRRKWNFSSTVLYGLFLCWLLVGVCLYAVRIVACYRLKVLSYKCQPNAAFSHSAQVEFYWLVTKSLHIVIAIVMLQKYAEFPGYIAIFRRLRILPDFWSLFFLLLASLSRYAIMLALSRQALFHVIAL